MALLLLGVRRAAAFVGLWRSSGYPSFRSAGLCPLFVPVPLPARYGCVFNY
jgi:hypothetical protein